MAIVFVIMVTKDLTLLSCMVAVADLENVQNHFSFGVARQFLCSSFVSYSAEDGMDKKGQHNGDDSHV